MTYLISCNQKEADMRIIFYVTNAIMIEHWRILIGKYVRYVVAHEIVLSLVIKRPVSLPLYLYIPFFNFFFFNYYFFLKLSNSLFGSLCFMDLRGMKLRGFYNLEQITSLPIPVSIVCYIYNKNSNELRLQF